MTVGSVLTIDEGRLGLNVMPVSDDPGMLPTSLGVECRILADDLAVPADRLREMALAGVEA